jgi:hypothetical protein
MDEIETDYHLWITSGSAKTAGRNCLPPFLVEKKFDIDYLPLIIDLET